MPLGRSREVSHFTRDDVSDFNAVWIMPPIISGTDDLTGYPGDA
jgi:hypothetical protein